MRDNITRTSLSCFLNCKNKEHAKHIFLLSRELSLLVRLPAELMDLEAPLMSMILQGKMCAVVLMET